MRISKRVALACNPIRGNRKIGPRPVGTDRAKRLPTLAAVVFATVIAPASGAEYGYVTDQMDVHVRTGKSVEHKIVKTISSGTRFTVLGSDKKAGYTKVQLESGATGWLLSRFILAKPIARTELARVTQKLTRLEVENRELKAKLTNIASASNKTETEKVSLAKEKDQLNNKLAAISHTAANAVQIEQQRDALQEQVIRLKRTMETLKRDNQSLKGSKAQYWFFIGATVLFLGIALGLVIPRIKLRSKSSWNDTL